MEKFKYPLKRHFVFCLLLLNESLLLYAQNTTTDVLNNTVTRCTAEAGTVANVSTVRQLKDAIIRANANGGNMTILIADGAYQIASTSWYPYVTANDLVFRSASGNRNAVIITGGGMRDAGGVENGFYFTGNNITVADLTIRSLGNHAIATHGDSLTIYNVRFQDTFEQMFKGTSAGDGADYGVIKHCLFEYTAGIGPQFYIGGIDIHKGAGWVVQDNVFKNIKSPSGSIAEHAIHFWNNASNNTVERNLIINCDRGIGFGLGNSGNTGGLIRNNMIYNDGSGKFSDVGIGLETSPNTMVYNNTIYLETYPNAIEYRFPATSSADIQNNLCNKAIQSRDGASATLNKNITNAQASWFVNPQAGNLRLASAISSVVKKGAALPGLVLNDMDKTPRPVGAGIDIGACEYNPLLGIWADNGETLGSQLFQNYPNPFYAKTTIHYSISKRQKVTVTILDFAGHNLITLTHSAMPAGKHTVEFDARSLPAGFYLIELTAGAKKMLKRCLLL